jgi:hypothetical protein
MKNIKNPPKSKKQIYKINDLVKIVIPEFFVRCGYLLTPSIVKDEIDNDPVKVQIIIDFLSKFDIVCKNDVLLGLTFKDNEAYRKITYALGYAIAGNRGLGGKSRQIFTESKPKLKNKVFEVVGKFTKKTGDYYGSSSYQGYFDPYPEYEPGGLRNEKTHVILEVVPQNDVWVDSYKIEAKNVIKYGSEI